MTREIKIAGWIVALVAALVVVLGIGAGLYLYTTSPHFFRIARGVDQRAVRTTLAELDGAVFVQGMQGAENLYLEPDAVRLYVTDLQGSVYLLDGDARAELAVVKSRKVGGFVLGIDKGPDGNLYAGVSRYDTNSDWIAHGGAVCRLDPKLNDSVKMTEEFPGINGLAFDGEGRCYFASSNFDFLYPQGQVYVMRVTPGITPSAPEIAIANIGLANGLRYDRRTNRLYVADTLEQVSAFTPGQEATRKTIYRKTKYREAFDDLCIDTQGRLWMTDPIGSPLKMYDPQANRVTRFYIEGIGQTSACRVREEQGEDIIYVTEIKQPADSKTGGPEFNGRGVVSIPLASLFALLDE